MSLLQKKIILEIACFSPDAALLAQQAGADRIELCDNYEAGGITPGLELTGLVRKKLTIDLFVMVRPRAGNFIYNDQEINRMKYIIRECKQIGAEGVVLGILTRDGRIDIDRCSELAALAKPMKTTFHRAFDEVNDHMEALENIIKCGFDKILTSGKQPDALRGASLITELIKKANDRILIMPGGGVRSAHVIELLKSTGACEVHSSAINKLTMLPDENEIRRLKAKITA